MRLTWDSISINNFIGYGIYAHNASPGTAASPNAMFDFATQSSYQITIRCTDSNGEFREDKLEVDIISGDRLEFTHSSGKKGRQQTTKLFC